jgi:hypothetical protein
VPPRYAFWTILIDRQPTAFRARLREELLPTLVQLQRTHPAAEMKWFAHGRLWDSPEQQQWAQKNKRALQKERSRDWRPGGAHKDPRARFQKKGPGRPAARSGPPAARRDLLPDPAREPRASASPRREQRSPRPRRG